jgi:hypothetical protein
MSEIKKQMKELNEQKHVLMGKLLNLLLVFGFSMVGYAYVFSISGIFFKILVGVMYVGRLFDVIQEAGRSINVIKLGNAVLKLGKFADEIEAKSTTSEKQD